MCVYGFSCAARPSCVVVFGVVHMFTSVSKASQFQQTAADAA